MNRSKIILTELSELNSPLAQTEAGTPYTVPAGYFEGLAEAVLRRIRALEAQTAAEEIAHLSPLLSKLNRQMPYSLPEGYFESLEESVLYAVQDDNTDAAGETKQLSPLLSGLKKEMPYSVPEGYFSGLDQAVTRHTTDPVQQVKVVRITHRRWFRIAAAAVMTGLIVTAGLIFMHIRQNQNSMSVEQLAQNAVHQSSDKDLNDFAEVLGADDMASTNAKADNADMLKDISSNELKSFLDETSDNETYNN